MSARCKLHPFLPHTLRGRDTLTLSGKALVASLSAPSGIASQANPDSSPSPPRREERISARYKLDPLRPHTLRGRDTLLLAPNFLHVAARNA